MDSTTIHFDQQAANDVAVNLEAASPLVDCDRLRPRMDALDQMLRDFAVPQTASTAPGLQILQGRWKRRDEEGRRRFRKPNGI